jgi:hypothetical protein
MKSASKDLRFLTSGVEILENYLLSNHLNWPVSSGAPYYHQFNLGNLELALNRLKAFKLTDAQQATLDTLDVQINTIRERWRSMWGQKAGAEFRARLNLWRNFLIDYQESAKSNFDRYAHEVTQRVQLQLLMNDATGIPVEEIQLLDGLDKLLKSTFKPGKFIWEADLASGFPPQVYWYLYGEVNK